MFPCHCLVLWASPLGTLCSAWEELRCGALTTVLTELAIRLHTGDRQESPAAPTCPSDHEVTLIIPKGVAIPSWSKGS